MSSLHSYILIVEVKVALLRFKTRSLWVTACSAGCWQTIWVLLVFQNWPYSLPVERGRSGAGQLGLYLGHAQSPCSFLHALLVVADQIAIAAAG